MAKKEALIIEAERLFVQEQCTINEIALRLKCGEKTIRNWKEESKRIGNDWDLKRSQYRAARQAFHEELYEFARLLMQKIKEDLQNGEKVDAGRMYSLAKIIPLITKTKDYEAVVKKETDGKNAGSGSGITEDVAKMIQREILGIPDDDSDVK